MMKKKVFWTGIEYSYTIEAEEYGKLKGGFVYAFIKAFDVREALTKVLHQLKEMKLEPIEIEFLKPYKKEMEWETDEQTNHYLNLFQISSKTTDVIFDDFYAYKID